MRTAVRCPSPSQGAGGSRQPGGLVPGLSPSPGVLSRLRGLCLEHRLQGCSPVPHEGVLAHPRAQRERQGFCSPGKGRPRAGSQGKSQADVAHSRRRARLLQLKPFPGEQGAELKHPHNPSQQLLPIQLVPVAFQPSTGTAPGSRDQQLIHIPTKHQRPRKPRGRTVPAETKRVPQAPIQTEDWVCCPFPALLSRSPVPVPEWSNTDPLCRWQSLAGPQLPPGPRRALDRPPQALRFRRRPGTSALIPRHPHTEQCWPMDRPRAPAQTGLSSQAGERLQELSGAPGTLSGNRRAAVAAELRTTRTPVRQGTAEVRGSALTLLAFPLEFPAYFHSARGTWAVCFLRYHSKNNHWEQSVLLMSKLLDVIQPMKVTFILQQIKKIPSRQEKSMQRSQKMPAWPQHPV